MWSVLIYYLSKILCLKSYIFWGELCWWSMNQRRKYNAMNRLEWNAEFDWCNCIVSKHRIMLTLSVETNQIYGWLFFIYFFFIRLCTISLSVVLFHWSSKYMLKAFMFIFATLSKMARLSLCTILEDIQLPSRRHTITTQNVFSVQHGWHNFTPLK